MEDFKSLTSIKKIDIYVCIKSLLYTTLRLLFYHPFSISSTDVDNNLIFKNPNRLGNIQMLVREKFPGHSELFQ